nr:hypothetical protein BgiMline_001717 [Biomphalaria glabrata]
MSLESLRLELVRVILQLAYCTPNRCYEVKIIKLCLQPHALNRGETSSEKATRPYHKQSEHVAVKNLKRFRQISGRDEDVSETDHRKVPPQHDTEWKEDITETQESEGSFDDEGELLKHCELLSKHSDGWLC